MLSSLLVDIKLDHLPHFANVETSTIQSACAEIEADKLKQILKKYTAVDDMFTQQYLYGKNENIKLLVDIGKAVDVSDEAEHMYNKLAVREPLYVRCLVEAFRTWHTKTKQTVAVPVVVKVDEFGQPLAEVKIEP